MKKYIFYKTQIEGLLDVAETVRVIEKSAASYIHFLKKKVRALLEYKRQIQMMLGRLSRFYWNNNHPLLQEKVHGEMALLVITGEKGLVGGLYHELINEVIIRSKDYKYIWVIGNKGEEYLNEEGIQAERISTSFDFSNLPHSEEIQEMTEYLFNQFQKTNLKNVDVLYASFISFAKQNPAIVKFLPFSFIRKKPFNFVSTNVKIEANMYNKQLADGFPIFEPSKKFIFNELLKKYINVYFAEIILEAKLSELVARTVTAESAVKETEQLVKKFNREFLKAKHLTITQKQVESFSVHQLTKI